MDGRSSAFQNRQALAAPGLEGSVPSPLFNRPVSSPPPAHAPPGVTAVSRDRCRRTVGAVGHYMRDRRTACRGGRPRAGAGGAGIGSRTGMKECRPLVAGLGVALALMGLFVASYAEALSD